VTDAAAPTTEPTIPRERGWGLVVVATVALLVFPATPLLRVLLPVEQTALLLAPALAALAIVGWIGGGRAALAIVWTVLAAWSVAQLSGAGLFSALQAGWALLVAAAFGVLALVRKDPAVPFLPRALRAIGISVAAALLVSLVVPGGPARIADGMAAESGRRAEATRTDWRQVTSMPEFRQLVAQNPQADSLAALVDRQLGELPATARQLFPALAALEALAALALAWALYHRLGRSRIGPPLARLREFRFNDHLVWGVVAGLGLTLLPGVSIVKAIGANLLLFFGALYTMRGAGVFLWMLSPGPIATAALFVVAMLFWNFIGVMALGLGVGDTWLDWRSRSKTRNT
jgi:hypothetical protein